MPEFFYKNSAIFTVSAYNRPFLAQTTDRRVRLYENHQYHRVYSCDCRRGQLGLIRAVRFQPRCNDIFRCKGGWLDHHVQHHRRCGALADYIANDYGRRFVASRQIGALSDKKERSSLHGTPFFTFLTALHRNRIRLLDR